MLLSLSTKKALPVVLRASRLMASAPKVQFKWHDPLDLEAQLHEDEKMVVQQVRSYADAKLMPRVTQSYRTEVCGARIPDR